MTAPTCAWCYQPAAWGAWTPRHGWHDLCQQHYDDIAQQLRANLLDRVSRGPLADVLQVTR